MNVGVRQFVPDFCLLPYAFCLYLSVLSKSLIDEAVEPALAGFGRRDHWMMRAAGVLAGVPVRRRIAAQRDAAGLTGAQMHPAAADFHALLALVFPRVANGFNCAEMFATGCHGASVS